MVDAPPAPNGSVLVVEDHAASAQGLRHLLVSRGLPAAVVSDAESALREVARGGYALVVADYDLGDREGDLLRRIRQSRPDLPVLVVTARDRKGLLVLVAELGLVDCLEKPVRPEALLEAVERTLRR